MVKYCPILAIAYPNEGSEQICNEDECAWWNSHIKCCHIKTIGR